MKDSQYCLYGCKSETTEDDNTSSCDAIVEETFQYYSYWNGKHIQSTRASILATVRTGAGTEVWLQARHNYKIKLS